MIQLFIPATVLLAALVGGLVAYRLRSRAALRRWLLALLATAASFVSIWLALIGALLAALYEPWPISLRQGPDTDYAHGCYERHLMAPLPEGFTRVYCREEWGFGGDSIDTLRFSYADPAEVAALVDRLALARVEDPARPGFRYLRSSHWWPREPDLRALPEAYASGDREYLWVDPNARLAYYQRAGF